MSSINRGNQIIGGVAIILFIGAIIYLTVALANNSRLANDVRDGKLTAETLLSEKLLLDKEISKLRSQLATLRNDNTNMNGLVASRSREIEDLQQANQNLKQKSTTVSNLKTEVQQQLKINRELEQYINVIKDSVAHLKSSNEDVSNLLVRLQDENKALKDNLKSLQGITLNNLLAEASKKNGQLTIKSAKTRNITVTVDVPAQSNNLSLKVTSPDGRVLSSDNGEVAVKVIHAEASPRAFYVPGSPATGRQFKRVEIVYKPKEKLNTGVYKIEVLDPPLSIGSLQVRLR